MTCTNWKSADAPPVGIRAAVRGWVQRRGRLLLEDLRTAEVDGILPLFPRAARVLDIGAGSGWQAAYLSQHGFHVDAIDIAGGVGEDERVRDVTVYDGRRIPFADGTFDVVFSSNVLEHVPHVRDLQREIRRVVKPAGVVVHVVPSSVWRCWTSVGHLFTLSRPVRHGEHASNAFDEVLFFRRASWRTLFEETGWTIERELSNELFYTGHLLLGRSLSLRMRRALAAVLGGSCHVFVLRP